MNQEIHHQYHKVICIGYKFDNQMKTDKGYCKICHPGRVGLPRWILICYSHSLLNPLRTLLLDRTQSQEFHCLTQPPEIVTDLEAATMSPEH